MAYIGRYINMDRSVERRRAVEARLMTLGCADRYERFSEPLGGGFQRARAKPLAARYPT
jgi:hypothetical protein